MRPLQTLVKHEEMNKTKIIQTDEERELKYKAAAQLAKWKRQWEKTKKDSVPLPIDKKEAADQLTREAEEVQWKIERLLKNSLNQAKVRWEELKNAEPYPYEAPAAPAVLPNPLEPNKEAECYQPVFRFLDKIFRSRKQAIIAESEKLYEADYQQYLFELSEAKAKNEQQQKEYQQKLQEWNQELSEYEKEKARYNEKVEQMRIRYLSSEPDAVLFFAEKVIDKLDFPISFVEKLEAAYISETKTLAVEYQFPCVADLPTLQKVIFLEEKDEISEVHFDDEEMQKKYEQLIYQMILVLLNKIYRNMEGKVATVILNGKLVSSRKYLLSIKTHKTDFEQIKLNTLDLQKWFSTLEGTLSLNLFSEQEVVPLFEINKER